MNSFPYPEGLPSVAGGIDWKFIASIYPADLILNHDKYTMKTIIQDFIKPQSFDGIPSNLASNFLYILQIIMKKLLENQKKTQKKLENQIKINEALKSKISNKDYDYSDDENMKDIMDNTTINKSKISSFLCPVCLNCYTSLKYLDMHFFTHHYELSDIWQILRTPHYDGFTADPTSKLIATSTEKSQLRQTIQFLGEEVILEQKDNDMKIKNYFRKKFLKVNNKLDQISSNINNESMNNSKIHHHSKKTNYSKDESSSKEASNEYNAQNDDYASEKFEYGSNSSNQSDNEVVINTNYQNNNSNNVNYNNNNNNTSNNSNNANNNNNNINMTNTNFTTSTNIFVISDSNITENEPDIKNKSSPIATNYKPSPISPNSYQFSSNNMNSLSTNRIESNMISDNQPFKNSTNLKAISEDSNENIKPIKVSKIRSRKNERVKKAVLETDSSYNDS